MVDNLIEVNVNQPTTDVCGITTGRPLLTSCWQEQHEGGLWVQWSTYGYLPLTNIVVDVAGQPCGRVPSGLCAGGNQR